MFTAQVLEHFYTPRFRGRLERPSGAGLAGSIRAGQFVAFQVLVSSGRIEDARFETWGCVPAVACADYLAERVVGLSVEAAREVTPSEVERGLGGLPARRRFCAELAVTALRQALQQEEQPV